MGSEIAFDRRTLGYSIAAGLSSLAVSGCSPSGMSSARDAALSDTSTLAGGVVGRDLQEHGTRQFIDASAFVSPNTAKLKLHEGWPVLDFPAAPGDAMAVISLPVDASVVAVDLVWIAGDGGRGAVRWIGGLAWPEEGTGLNNRATSTDWQGVVATVPQMNDAPVITRLGHFFVNPDAACLKLHLSREAYSSGDTLENSAFLLGASIRVIAESPPSVDMSSLAISDTLRLRGVNINPGPQHFYTDSVWAGLWSKWDWNEWVKPMIDDSISIGANSFRTIGNTLVVSSGMLKQNDYLDRWRQLLDYTASRNAYFFPCGGDLGHWGKTTSSAAAEDLYSSWSEMLTEYPHIIGVDVTNEATTTPRNDKIGYMQPDYWLDTVTRLGDIIREITQKPVTHSRAVSTSARWINGAIHTDLISDFISIHCYYTPELQDADRLRESRWGSGKQILLGEMGAGMDLSRNDRVARYRAVKALVDANPDNVGVLVWSGYDLKDASKPNDQKGLFDKTRRPRADIASEFSAFSITR